jgi:survival-of-motor-neuron-related-splicing factor 30
VGVPAPKRLKVDERVAGREAPKKLEAQEGDDARTLERKKKLLKNFKSKQRLAAADAEQTERAQSWQAFRTGKGATKHKPGFLTNPKKESMFAVPEGGRVGVIGSGKGVTPAPERRKNQFDEA